MLLRQIKIVINSTTTVIKEETIKNVVRVVVPYRKSFIHAHITMNEPTTRNKGI